MKVRHAFFALAVTLLGAGSASASTGYVDTGICYVHSPGNEFYSYSTGYRIMSTIHHDANENVGWGNLTIWDAAEPCSGHGGAGNNTMTRNVSIEVRNTVTWELLSTSNTDSYWWSSSTNACEVTLVIRVWGERYESELDDFDQTAYGTPIGCDP